MVREQIRTEVNRQITSHSQQHRAKATAARAPDSKTRAAQCFPLSASPAGHPSSSSMRCGLHKILPDSVGVGRGPNPEWRGVQGRKVAASRGGAIIAPRPDGASELNKLWTCIRNYLRFLKAPLTSLRTERLTSKMSACLCYHGDETWGFWESKVVLTRRHKVNLNFLHILIVMSECGAVPHCVRRRMLRVHNTDAP